MAKVDAWAARQDDEPGRSEAIRRLVELGLTVKQKSRSSDQQTRRARDMAAQTIERKLDPAAPEDERVQRKRRLLKGPSEFIDARIDRPKVKK
jgi:hypothetical protein